MPQDENEDDYNQLVCRRDAVWDATQEALRQGDIVRAAKLREEVTNLNIAIRELEARQRARRRGEETADDTSPLKMLLELIASLESRIVNLEQRVNNLEGTSGS